MLSALIAAVLMRSYAPTPQQAALKIVSFDVKIPPVVRRTNVAGRFAAVLTSGGMMEGAPVTAPILLEHFSFGWQPLDLLNGTCSLSSYGLPRQTKVALMREMPKLQDDGPCSGLLRDSGPASDVQNVRSLMRGPLIPGVAVSGNWALGEWYGAGGGQSLYHKRARRWTLVTDGGGAMGVEEMREYGVPRAAWCVFRLYNARCAR